MNRELSEKLRLGSGDHFSASQVVAIQRALDRLRELAEKAERVARRDISITGPLLDRACACMPAVCLRCPCHGGAAQAVIAFCNTELRTK